MTKAHHGEQFFIARAALTFTCKHFRNVYKENVEKKFCNEVIASFAVIRRYMFMVNTFHTFEMCLCEASCFLPEIVSDLRKRHKFTERDSVRFFYSDLKGIFKVRKEPTLHCEGYCPEDNCARRLRHSIGRKTVFNRYRNKGGYPLKLCPLSKHIFLWIR